MVADAGHLVMLEHPEVVDRALFALVERGLARAAAQRGRAGRRRTVVGLAAARRASPARGPRHDQRGHRRGLRRASWCRRPDDMVAVGRQLATRLRAGDLVVLSGDLGRGRRR